ncbi:hypothetical protein AB0K00_15890 [Dactylosporangium sp. NPDC049525]|uniref:hypothetical protein n=1 Tax=Dactylosporangium sp. NPDC049525 TaxID=3154730 RepID=UPI00343DDF6B
MSGVALPPVADTVLVAAVDALPARLRKKVDEAVTRFSALPVTAEDGRFTVAIDDTTTVTLVTDGGVVRSADAATCTCLLAPNCLHRAAVLALAPAYAEGSAAETSTASQDAVGVALPAGAGDVAAPAASQVVGATDPGTDDTAVPAADGNAVPVEATAEPLTVQQRAAVEHLWRAAVDVLAAGVTGSGTVARTALLRAAHEGQACKVYRPAAAARIVAAMLRAARTGDPDFRLWDLTAALQELIGVLQRLRSTGGGPAEGLLGTARRAYELQGSLRLHGLCTTAVLADSGYAGVVTYVVDRDGGLWMIADLMPGDARRAAKAGNATVALGETALSHRALTRAGLVVSGATASATRQLGAGKSVRAVTAGGCGWHEEPLARLWAVPLGEQVHRAFEALALPVTDRRAGDDLVFLSVRIEGTGSDDAVHATASGGTPLTLRVADDSPALAYRENLRLLGHTAGLELLMVARPDPARPGTVFPLSVAPLDGTGWNLPAAQGGHADLAFDRLHRSHLPQTGTLAALDTTGTSGTPDGDHAAQAKPAQATPSQATPQLTAVAGRAAATTGDPVLRLLAAQVERTVSGGRTVHTFAAGRGPSDATRLRRARLDTGAVLLDRLTEAACTRPRDTFGRLAGDDGSAFAQAWLATAVYTDAATRAVAEATWLPVAPP